MTDGSYCESDRERSCSRMCASDVCLIIRSQNCPFIDSVFTYVNFGVVVGGSLVNMVVYSGDSQKQLHFTTRLYRFNDGDRSGRTLACQKRSTIESRKYKLA